jgi:hypothetical protein
MWMLRIALLLSGLVLVLSSAALDLALGEITNTAWCLMSLGQTCIILAYALREYSFRRREPCPKEESSHDER